MATPAATDPVAEREPWFEEIQDGNADLDHPPVCRMVDALRRFGPVAVTECGWLDLIGVHDQVPPQVGQGRECVARAMAARRPFALVWRTRGADPGCDDMALLRNPANAHCGYMSILQTRAIVGIQRRRGYALYRIVNIGEESKEPWIGNQEPEVQRSSNTIIETCSTLEQDQQCDSVDLDNCYVCNPPLEDDVGRESTLCDSSWN